MRRGCSSNLGNFGLVNHKRPKTHFLLHSGLASPDVGLAGAALSARAHQGAERTAGSEGVIGDSVDIPFRRQLQRSIHHFVDAIDDLGVDARILRRSCRSFCGFRQRTP